MNIRTDYAKRGMGLRGLGTTINPPSEVGGATTTPPVGIYKSSSGRSWAVYETIVGGVGDKTEWSGIRQGDGAAAGPAPTRALLQAEIEEYEEKPFKVNPVWGAVSAVSGAACAYHGYKRNDSVGWAIGWSIFGSMLPFLAVPVALAQGFGKRA